MIKWIYLWSPTEGKQFHLFLALQHTTAGLLQYGGGSYQSGLVEEADGCLNLWNELVHSHLSFVFNSSSVTIFSPV